MIIDKWISWMEKNGRSEIIFSEAGKPESKLDKDWIKKVSKSDTYKNFIDEITLNFELPKEFVLPGQNRICDQYRWVLIKSPYGATMIVCNGIID